MDGCGGKLLRVVRGDSTPLVVTTTTDLSLFSSLIFSAKRSYYDPDSAALIQKALALGITVGSDPKTAVINFVPTDTAAWASDHTRLVWDLQGQKVGGEVQTVAIGVLEICLDVTQNTSSSVPIYTTNPPIPGGGTQAFPFSWGDASPQVFQSVPAGLVATATLILTQAFDGIGTALSLGTALSPSLFMNASQNLPLEVGEYVSNPGIVVSSPTDALITIIPGAGASQGAGYAFLEVVSI